MNDDGERLIARHLDGTATPEETGRLDALLQKDPEARRSLYLAAEQGDALRDLLGERRNAALAASAAGGGSGSRSRLFLGLAAGFAILFVGAVLLGLSSERPETIPIEPIAVQPAPRPAEPPPSPAPTPVAPEAPVVVPAPAPAPVVTTPVAPAPAPAPVVAPAPAPAPAPSAVRETVAAVAVLEKAGGDVRIVSAGQSTPAVAGHKLLSGEGVETGGRGRAVLALDQGGQLEIGADTLVSRVVAATVTLDRGFVRADLPAARPRGSLVLVTGRARAEAGGTKFSLRTGTDATWMEVDRGRARLTRSEDNASIEIAAGQLGAVGAGFPFVPRGQDAAVDPARVDAAIARGIEFLRTSNVAGAMAKKDSDELILLTLLHGGVTESDPQFKRLLSAILQDPLERTYNVALQAMILEELDRVKYQHRLQQCGQFLVDNQCKNGQWSYGTPTPFVNDLPVPSEAPRDVQSGPGNRARDFSAPKEKPKVTRRLPVKKLRDGPATGDNSNSQYAALGLRACFDAGIELPRDVVQLAKDWWIKCQGPDEAPNNGYDGARGWTYQKPGKKDDDDDDKNNMLGSMTAGGVGSLVICDYILGLDWRKNIHARAGLGWLAAHFTVSDNPGGKPWRHYYFLYGMERAGVLAGTEKFGAHAWYPLGARFLLDAQLPNGSWKLEQQSRTNPVWDTCFAILFLKRATKPLKDVASEDRYKKR